MADFCAQCAEAMGFPPWPADLDGLCTLEMNKKNLYSAALCETCGYIQVNYLGQCISKSCLSRHTDGKLFHLEKQNE